MKRFPALALIAFAGLVLTAQVPGSAGEGVRVYGEFQDQACFDETLAEDPLLAEATEQELYDGLSGATLQTKTLGREVPGRWVCLAGPDGKPRGEPVAWSDGFGQYWLVLPPGTWTLVAGCEGWENAVRTVTLTEGKDVCLNFFLRSRP